MVSVKWKYRPSGSVARLTQGSVLVVVILLTLKMKTPNSKPPFFVLVSVDGLGAGHQATVGHLRFWALVVKQRHQFDAFLVPQGTGLPTPVQGEPLLPRMFAMEVEMLCLFSIPPPTTPNAEQTHSALLSLWSIFPWLWDQIIFIFSHKERRRKKAN